MKGDVFLGARQKLNAAYFCGSLLVAGLVGAVTQSWTVFFLTALVLLGCALSDGSIRPTGRR